MDKLNEWINYKEIFFSMYGKHIYQHYQGDIDAVKTLKYEILFM